MDVENEVSVFTQSMLEDALATYPELSTYNPVLPATGVRANTPPLGKVALYWRTCTVGNFRFPLNDFQAAVLRHYRVGFAQLHPHGWQKVTLFEMFCRAIGREPDLDVFRCIFRLAQSELSWYTFEKKPGNNFHKLESKSLHQWRDTYFLIDESALGRRGFRAWHYVRDASHSRAPTLRTVAQDDLKETCSSANLRLRPYNDIVLRLAGMNSSWARTELRPVVTDGQGRGMPVFFSLPHAPRKRYV